MRLKTDEKYLHKWALHIKEYTKNTLLHKKITVRYDSKTGRRGYYGRLLAYIIIAGTNFNIDLVRSGFARVSIRKLPVK
ncbi:MAG: thermonuclease family protein [Spirochaetales bacterium]|nr:thermonuclease family protein [Spirochaetales bacterium]